MLLTQLHPNEGQIKGVPSNPRYITDEDFAALKKSLRDFRKMLALRPMIVDEDFNILGGNMRYQALCRLRDEKVKVGAFAFGNEIPDEWVKQDCTLTEKEKREFVIKDNQERGQNDWDKLANEWDAGELQEWGVDAAFWEQGSKEELPQELQGLDLTPDELEKIEGGDVVDHERLIIVFKKEQKDTLAKLLGLETIEKVLYRAEDFLK